MNDDRTVAWSEFHPLVVRVEKGRATEREHRFTEDVRIGRSADCRLQFLDRSVSKVHADIRFDGQHWCVYDLHSRNGTFLDGVQVESQVLTREHRLELGKGGPILHIVVESPLDDGPARRASSSSERSGQSNDRDRTDTDNLSPSAPIPAMPVPSSDSRVSPLLQVEPPADQATHRHRALGAERHESDVPVGGDDHEHAFDNDSAFSARVKDLPPSEPPGGRESEGNADAGSPSLTSIIQRSLERRPHEHSGERTQMIQRTFDHVLRRRSRKFYAAIAVACALAIGFGGVAWYQTRQVEGLRDMAAHVFYSMKAAELELAQLEDDVLQELGPAQLQSILEHKRNLQLAKQRTHEEYDAFLEKLGVYSPNMPPEDRLIFRMARLFGESEVDIPPEFVQEVKAYIRKWQSTKTLAKAIARAKQAQYGAKVTQAMLAEHMPPQFFYLALKESEFQLNAVGPKTRFGIAKGPWQFIPSTAQEYGLKTGPLVDYPRYDPRDDRHNFQKATKAAAKYLRFLYRTEAQASGLLVMASYNWGPTRVRTLINQLPENPRDRNFWEFTKRFDVPQQTKDYVYYIFSAAVIGENPALFGFDFANPLEDSVSISSSPREERTHPARGSVG